MDTFLVVFSVIIMIILTKDDDELIKKLGM